MTRRSLLMTGILTLLFGGHAAAATLSGDIFFTTFSGGANVHKVAFSYDDGTSIFTQGSPVNIGATIGADGIAGNPQNADLLLVGGQGGRINTISKTTGLATAYFSPVSVFHLEVPDATTVYGSGIPGFLAKHTINPDGSVAAGTVITLSGPDTTITQLISTPSGFFYTASGGAGTGTFGTLAFTGAATATTTRLYGPGGSVSGALLPAAHGGVYDPFTGHIILGGDDHITQLDLFGAIISDLFVPGTDFDQGTVDGLGHLFWADNGGDLFFLDYSSTSLVAAGSNFTHQKFLASTLDDIAPLVGSGTTDDPVPEPATLVIWSMLGMCFAGACRWRRRNGWSKSTTRAIHDVIDRG